MENRKYEQWKTELAGLTGSNFLPSFSLSLPLSPLFLFPSLSLPLSLPLSCILDKQAIDLEKVSQLILISWQFLTVSSVKSGQCKKYVKNYKEYLKFIVRNYNFKKSLTD